MTLINMKITAETRHASRLEAKHCNTKHVDIFGHIKTESEKDGYFGPFCTCHFRQNLSSKGLRICCDKLLQMLVVIALTIGEQILVKNSRKR